MKKKEFLTPKLYRACLKSIAEAEHFSVELILSYTLNLPEYKDKVSFLQDLQVDFKNGTLPALIKKHLEAEYIGNTALIWGKVNAGSINVQLERQLNDLKTFFKTFAPALVAEYNTFVEVLHRMEESVSF